MPGIDLRAATPSLHPRAPLTLEDTGLTRDLVTQLVLKALHASGELAASDIARRLGLTFSIVQPSLEDLSQQRHCEIAGGLLVGEPTYRYRITDAGRARAALFLAHNHYAGPAPVPLAQYRAYLEAFARVPSGVSPDRVRVVFDGLDLGDRVLDEIGAAVSGGHSMLLYGPPGNGKSTIAHRIRNLLEGEIAIPFAIEVEGSIVQVFDPVSHERLPSQDPDDGLAMAFHDDRRWARCRRPLVAVGGELTLDAFRVHFMRSAGFYRAPIQALANGGVLIIDDFGRQQCTPRELLNRWMVPLESRVDYLTLDTGLKFEMPFLPLIVFSTNLRPSALVDEAFLRRIQYKVHAESPTREGFLRIFERRCQDLGLDCDPGIAEGMLTGYFEPRGVALRGCQPRDLIGQALALAAYLGRPARLTADLLQEACVSYFVDDGDTPPPA